MRFNHKRIKPIASMEGSSSKVEFIKPVILKAGIPMAVSVAGLIWAKIIARRRRSTDSAALKEEEEEAEENCERSGLDGDVLGLRRMVESLQDTQRTLEMQFLCLCELKDRETVVMEMGKIVKLEMARIEILSREASLMEVEHQRIVENMVMEYVKVLEEMEYWKLETGVLTRKVKKLCRKIRQQSSLIIENRQRIAAVENEKRAVKKIEDEMRELRRCFDQMNLEKIEILDKLCLVEESVSKIKDEETLSAEDQNNLLKELEEIQKEHAAEEEELVHLRWSNAYLRHELARSCMKQDQEQNLPKPNNNNNSLQLTVAEEQEGHDEEDHGSDHELISRMVSPVGTLLSSSSLPWIRDGGCHIRTKRKKLLQKMRKWVEGSDHHKVKPRDIV